MRARTHRQVRPLVLVVVLLMVSCSRGSEDPAHPLADLLIDTGPDGYERVDGPSGPLDRDEAATALGYVDRTRLRRHLVESGFQDGYARVWRDEGGFATAIVLDFVSSRRAAETVGFASRRLQELRDTETFSVKGVPGAQGYTLGGSTRSGDDPLVCRLVWFARSTRAFEVRVCDDTPPPAPVVQDLAARQLERAREAA